MTGQDYRSQRMFVVIARDASHIWRVKDIMATGYDDAVEKYNAMFDYVVVGVGLLGGSGHPINWLEKVDRLPTDFYDAQSMTSEP